VDLQRAESPRTTRSRASAASAIERQLAGGAGATAPRLTAGASVASLGLALLAAAASIAGLLLMPAGLYGRDPAVVAVFAGQDAANLLVVLPLLLGTLWAARRGSTVGLLLWPGALFSLLYTYALYLVGAPFGALFLLYAVLVPLSAYATIGAAAGIDGDGLRRGLLSRAPSRPVGGVLVGVGLLATVGLLLPVLAALGERAPVDPLLRARWVVDFAVGTPALLLGGVLLWRRAGLGYAVAAALLLVSGANGLAFAVGAVVGGLLTDTPVDAPVAAVHVVIAALSLAALALFLRAPSSRSPSGPPSPVGRSSA
jgi:hypothetical protein